MGASFVLFLNLAMAWPGCNAAPLAAPCDHPSVLRLAPGGTAGRVEGDLAQGERACWTLAAQAGQTLDVSVASPERNAVFQLYAPGWRVRWDGDFYRIVGDAFGGAADGDDATAWSGPVPRDGENLVVLGMTRGGGHYELRFAIR